MSIEVRYISNAETAEEFRDEMIYEVSDRINKVTGLSAEDAMRSLRDMLQALVFEKEEEK